MRKSTCIHCHKKSKTSLLCSSCGRIPINLELWSTVKEAQINLRKLILKINEIRRILKNFGIISNDDPFLKLINGWNEANLTTCLYLQLLEENKELLTKRVCDSCPNCNSSQLQELLYNLEMLPRKFYIIDCMFQLESCLRQVNQILSISSKNKNHYEELANSVLKKFELTKRDNEISRLFCFPAYVRNTLHSEGLHTHHKQSKGKIKGIQFEFKRNTLPYYSHWRHFYFFFDNILEIIQLMAIKSINPKNEEVKVLIKNFESKLKFQD